MTFPGVETPGFMPAPLSGLSAQDQDVCVRVVSTPGFLLKQESLLRKQDWLLLEQELLLRQQPSLLTEQGWFLLKQEPFLLEQL